MSPPWVSARVFTARSGRSVSPFIRSPDTPATGLNQRLTIPCGGGKGFPVLLVNLDPSPDPDPLERVIS